MTIAELAEDILNLTDAAKTRDDALGKVEARIGSFINDLDKVVMRAVAGEMGLADYRGDPVADATPEALSAIDAVFTNLYRGKKKP